MKKTTVLMLATVVTAVAMCALGAGQSSPKRRTPSLTNDDLGSAREVVAPPAEVEVAPTVSRSPEVLRGPIAWHRDMRRAIEVARAEEKLIVVDVYADWCGWCKKMDKIIYSDPAIVALSKRQVFVKVDAEDGGEGQHFAQQMRVNGYPTTIIMDSQGKVLNRAEGYIHSPGAFEQLVQKAQAR